MWLLEFRFLVILITISTFGTVVESNENEREDTSFAEKSEIVNLDSVKIVDTKDSKFENTILIEGPALDDKNIKMNADMKHKASNNSNELKNLNNSSTLDSEKVAQSEHTIPINPLSSNKKNSIQIAEIENNLSSNISTTISNIFNQIPVFETETTLQTISQAEEVLNSTSYTPISKQLQTVDNKTFFGFSTPTDSVEEEEEDDADDTTVISIDNQKESISNFTGNINPNSTTEISTQIGKTGEDSQKTAITDLASFTNSKEIPATLSASNQSTNLANLLKSTAVAMRESAHALEQLKLPKPSSNVLAKGYKVGAIKTTVTNPVAKLTPHVKPTKAASVVKESSNLLSEKETSTSMELQTVPKALNKLISRPWTRPLVSSEKFKSPSNTIKSVLKPPNQKKKKSPNENSKSEVQPKLSIGSKENETSLLNSLPPKSSIKPLGNASKQLLRVDKKKMSLNILAPQLTPMNISFAANNQSLALKLQKPESKNKLMKAPIKNSIPKPANSSLVNSPSSQKPKPKPPPPNTSATKMKAIENQLLVQMQKLQGQHKRIALREQKLENLKKKQAITRRNQAAKEKRLAALKFKLQQMKSKKQGVRGRLLPP